MPQLLPQPPLNSARRNDDELLIERISSRFSQRTRETNDESVGTLGAVDVEGHMDEPMGCLRPCAATAPRMALRTATVSR